MYNANWKQNESDKKIEKDEHYAGSACEKE